MHYEKFADGTVKCIEDEIPFEVPEGWAWTRLGSLFSTITGSTPSTKDSSLYGDEYPFYKPTDLDAGFDVHFSEDTVSEKGYKSGRILPVYSVLVTCIGATIGKTGYIRNSGICNQQINAILPNTFILPEYTYFCMCSEFEQQQIWTNSSATTLPILNKSKFDNLFFPVPPKAQQTRTVKRIKELLRFVEIIQQEKITLQETIKLTRSKILDLAIRGKLVPQDPNDEPASVLLEHIRVEKEELIKQGKIKCDKKESYIFRGDDNSYYEDINGKVVCIDNEIPFDIPDTWTWCRLKSIASNENNSFVDGPFGSDLKTIHYTENEEVRIVQLNNISEDGWKDNGKKYTTFSHAKNIERCISFPKDIVIAKMMPAGRTIILPSINSIYVISSDCIRLRADYRLNKEYLMFMLNSPSINKCVLNTVQGIGRTRTSLNKMKELLIPVPPETEQQKISETIIKYFGYLTKIYSSL